MVESIDSEMKEEKGENGNSFNINSTITFAITIISLFYC